MNSQEDIKKDKLNLENRSEVSSPSKQLLIDRHPQKGSVDSTPEKQEEDELSEISHGVLYSPRDDYYDKTIYKLKANVDIFSDNLRDLSFQHQRVLKQNLLFHLHLKEKDENLTRIKKREEYHVTKLRDRIEELDGKLKYILSYINSGDEFTMLKDIKKHIKNKTSFPKASIFSNWEETDYKLANESYVDHFQEEAKALLDWNDEYNEDNKKHDEKSSYASTMGVLSNDKLPVSEETDIDNKKLPQSDDETNQLSHVQSFLQKWGAEHYLNDQFLPIYNHHDVPKGFRDNNENLIHINRIRHTSKVRLDYETTDEYRSKLTDQMIDQFLFDHSLVNHMKPMFQSDVEGIPHSLYNSSDPNQPPTYSKKSPLSKSTNDDDNVPLNHSQIPKNSSPHENSQPSLPTRYFGPPPGISKDAHHAALDNLRDDMEVKIKKLQLVRSRQDREIRYLKHQLNSVRDLERERIRQLHHSKSSFRQSFDAYPRHILSVAPSHKHQDFVRQLQHIRVEHDLTTNEPLLKENPLSSPHRSNKRPSKKKKTIHLPQLKKMPSLSSIMKEAQVDKPIWNSARKPPAPKRRYKLKYN